MDARVAQEREEVQLEIGYFWQGGQRGALHVGYNVYWNGVLWSRILVVFGEG